jgi:hypothetical protein
MIEVEIISQTNSAKVSDREELIVGPREASKFYTNTAIVNNTPVNVVVPRTGRIFVITAIVLSGDRGIGSNGAVVDLYESDISGTDATVETQIIQDEIAKQTRLVLTNLYITTRPGRWINVKADDVQVRANVAGFYVKI